MERHSESRCSAHHQTASAVRNNTPASKYVDAAGAASAMKRPPASFNSLNPPAMAAVIPLKFISASTPPCVRNAGYITQYGRGRAFHTDTTTAQTRNEKMRDLLEYLRVSSANPGDLPWHPGCFSQGCPVADAIGPAASAFRWSNRLP